MTRHLAIRNWAKFQHYKDRGPVWIKLYTELLDSPAWLALSDVARAQIVGLWMLAAKRENVLPTKAATLRALIGSGAPMRLPELLDGGWIEYVDSASRHSTDGASNSASNSASSGASETASPHARPRPREEGETERETTSPPPAREADDPFFADPGVVAFLGAIPVERHRAWAAIIGQWRQGEGWGAGAKPSDRQIADGLVAAVTAKDEGPLSQAFVAGCVRRAMRPVRAVHDDTGRELTYLDQVARGLIVPGERSA